ncbi:MAG TPA: SPOR domain-containing protein [Bacteroidales bacterium]|nr:SPOR domain-containing protein [Bacteroidales bacterium]HPS16205.1 SPOR domain-containing protein [Bacteroidales bacterium]
MRIKFLFLILLISFFSALNVFSQKTGKVEIIISDSRINTLVEKHHSWCETRGGIDGFRIQIYFDSGNNSKSRAVTVMNEFKSKHPKTEAYLMFQEPNYKIRVGNFRSRIDAQRFLHKITDEYPNAFIVKDNDVKFPLLEDEKDN